MQGTLIGKTELLASLAGYQHLMQRKNWAFSSRSFCIEVQSIIAIPLRRIEEKGLIARGSRGPLPSDRPWQQSSLVLLTEVP